MYIISGYDITIVTLGATYILSKAEWWGKPTKLENSYWTSWNREFINCEYQIASKCFQKHFLKYDMFSRGMKIASSLPNTQPILKSICAGFFQNVAQMGMGHKYYTLPKREIVYIHPGSALFKRAEPQWLVWLFIYLSNFNRILCELLVFVCRVVFQKIVTTKKEYMRGITPIDVSWLKEFSPAFDRQINPLGL